MDIELLAQQNQELAREVIRRSQVVEAWESIGAKVNPIGSMVTGLLMTHRDIDFHIYTDTLDIPEAFKAITQICSHPEIKHLDYRNLAQTDEFCLEWHVWFDSGDGKGLWQIDMIQILAGSTYDGFFERTAQKILNVLTPETKRTILTLKYQTPPTEQIMGFEYYQAVIQGGVQNWDEFTQWRKEHPANGIVMWQPE